MLARRLSAQRAQEDDAVEVTQVGRPSRRRRCHLPQLILRREWPTHHPGGVVLQRRLAAQHRLFDPQTACRTETQTGAGR